MKWVFAVTAAIMLLCMVGGSASAGWTVVNLNPAGATQSWAVGVSGGQQVGWAMIGGNEHASLWRGRAERWVDLNPAEAAWSRAEGVSGGRQVGYAGIHGSYHASLWSGTAESWVDLHALLPAGVYSWSEAKGVYASAGETRVTGYAVNAATDQWEAMLWHDTPDVVPEPSSFLALGSGLLALCGAIRRRK